MTPTLILSPRYTADSVNLWRAAVARGWDVTRLPSWRVPDDFTPREPVLFAEPLFNEAVAQRLGLRIIGPPEDFLPRLPREYTSREVRLMTAAEARSLAGPVFLKPPNRKLFPARVYASGAELPDFPADDPVLAAEPVAWEAEFRYFVRDRRVRAWSPYWLHGALARRGEEWLIDRDAAARTRTLVDRLLADGSIDLPPAVVIDAGVIRGVGPAVVEANEVSGSGLYGCDPVEVLDVLRAGAVAA
ncbi:ATP-grasp domain-containing protein [Paludisphaera sp.]|uniref:ATP-grasp domain-containing protein n=1 Tax=Paludisphaera sp. TaxID=2017432 RepID=UPI00301D1497